MAVAWNECGVKWTWGELNVGWTERRLNWCLMTWSRSVMMKVEKIRDELTWTEKNMEWNGFVGELDAGQYCLGVNWPRAKWTWTIRRRLRKYAFVNEFHALLVCVDFHKDIVQLFPLWRAFSTLNLVKWRNL